MYQAILFISFFLLGIPLFFKILLDSNIEKFFKQGKITSIRIFIFTLSIIISFLVAFACEHLLDSIIKIFSK